MKEFALLRNGEVSAIITTSRSQADLAADEPSYDVRPVSEVPLAVLERYRHWRERP